MDANEYQVQALRTSNPDHTEISRLTDGILGLNGEAGECADLLKKHLSQGHMLSSARMIDELGDVLWYVAQTAEGLGVSMALVMQRNLEKLAHRYPDGFDPERSLHRNRIQNGTE